MSLSSAQSPLAASTARSTAPAMLDASADSTPSRTISWPWTASLRRRCPTAPCPLNSSASRALRSCDQRGLGLPDNGKRIRTPTRPAGNGSPRAKPAIWCSSDIYFPPTLDGPSPYEIANLGYPRQPATCRPRQLRPRRRLIATAGVVEVWSDSRLGFLVNVSAARHGWWFSRKVSV